MSYDNEDTIQSENMRKMFVGGLKREITNETFRSYFSQFGELEDCVIITDTESKSRGFGFLTYTNSDMLQDVFLARPHNLDGKEVEVKRAMPREFTDPTSHVKTIRLFVGGFKNFDLEPDELRAYLEGRHPEKFGKLENIDFLKDQNSGTYKGFGFIDCSDFDFADRIAISESSFSLKGRRLTIKKAEPKRDRQDGGGPMRSERGARRGGVRGSYAGRGGGRGSSYGSGGGGYGGGGYNSGGGSYGENTGYNQSYSAGGYGGQSAGYNQSGYGAQGGYGGGTQQSSGYGGGAQQSSGYGGGAQQSSGYGGGYNQGAYSTGGYQQQQQQQGGYGQQSYGGQSYGGYGQQNGGGEKKESGGQRYQPY